MGRSGRASDLRGSLRARYGDEAGGVHLVRALEGGGGGAGALASRAAAFYADKRVSAADGDGGRSRCRRAAVPPPTTTSQHIQYPLLIRSTARLHSNFMYTELSDIANDVVTIYSDQYSIVSSMILNIINERLLNEAISGECA